MAADPLLATPDAHDPDTVRIVNLLTTRLASVLSDRLEDGKNDERNIVKIVTRLAPGLDATLNTFSDLMHSMIREELVQEIEDLKQETRIQDEESQVTAETVKVCSSIVSRIKRLREMRRCADITNGTKEALEQEDVAVSHASADLEVIDREKLRLILDDANNLVKGYNELMQEVD